MSLEAFSHVELVSFVRFWRMTSSMPSPVIQLSSNSTTNSLPPTNASFVLRSLRRSRKFGMLNYVQRGGGGSIALWPINKLILPVPSSPSHSSNGPFLNFSFFLFLLAVQGAIVQSDAPLPPALHRQMAHQEQTKLPNLPHHPPESGPEKGCGHADHRATPIGPSSCAGRAPATSAASLNGLDAHPGHGRGPVSRHRRHHEPLFRRAQSTARLSPGTGSHEWRLNRAIRLIDWFDWNCLPKTLLMIFFFFCFVLPYQSFVCGVVYCFLFFSGPSGERNIFFCLSCSFLF